MDGDHRKAGVARSAIPPRPANEGLVPRSPGTVGPLHSDSDGLERSARKVRLGGESSDRGTAYSRGGDRVRSMDGIARGIRAAVSRTFRGAFREDHRLVRAPEKEVPREEGAGYTQGRGKWVVRRCGAMRGLAS